MLTEKQIKKRLTEVMDPELNISIIDMGLVYRIEIKDGQVDIDLTLTSPVCPLAPMIKDEVLNKLKEIGVKKPRVKLVFDPPWSPDKMTKKGRQLLGIE